LQEGHKVRVSVPSGTCLCMRGRSHDCSQDFPSLSLMLCTHPCPDNSMIWGLSSVTDVCSPGEGIGSDGSCEPPLWEAVVPPALHLPLQQSQLWGRTQALCSHLAFITCTVKNKNCSLLIKEGETHLIEQAGSQWTWVQFIPSPCVTWDKSLNLPEPEFPCFKHGNENSSAVSVMWLLRESHIAKTGKVCKSHLVQVLPLLLHLLLLLL
jgi:hypothetical protein